MATALNRDDIIAGLRELIVELRTAGEVAGIRLVGGAALALRHFDRGTTQDLDSLHVRPGSDEAVAAAAAKVAQRFGWDPAWLNFDVTRADALPTLGREVEWETIYDQGGIVIQVAAQEPLLAMSCEPIGPAGIHATSVSSWVSARSSRSRKPRISTKGSTPETISAIAPSEW